jgi:hypothetical protein
MDTIKRWTESVMKTFHPTDATIEHLKNDNNFKVQVEFDSKSPPRFDSIKSYFPELTKEDIQAFINDARNANLEKVIILATCECFRVCDSEGNCRTVCYICYPPPAARCCCPGMCP